MLFKAKNLVLVLPD